MCVNNFDLSYVTECLGDLLGLETLCLCPLPLDLLRLCRGGATSCAGPLPSELLDLSTQLWEKRQSIGGLSSLQN